MYWCYLHCVCLCAKSLQLCPTLCDSMDYIVFQSPLSMGFSRQEYWRGLPCPPPGDLLDPEIKPTSIISPALADGFFTTSATWEEKLEIRALGGQRCIDFRALFKHPIERLLLNHKRGQDSWPPEEKNSIQGQRRGLITQSFCVIKLY